MNKIESHKLRKALLLALTLLILTNVSTAYEYDGYIFEFMDEPLVKYKDPVTFEQMNSSITSDHNNFREELPSILDGKNFELCGEYSYVYNGICVRNITDSDMRRILEKSKYVEAAYPNYRVHAVLDDSIGIMNVDEVHDMGITGDGVTIGIIDTGIDPNHESLDDMDDNPGTTDPKIIAFKDYINGRTEPYDDHGHGTHCAGIAAGTGGPTHRYMGMAPDSQLVGLKVLDSGGSGWEQDIIAAIEWAVINKGTYNIRVISMSLGGSATTGHDPMLQASNNAVNSGIVVVVAAGNSGPNGGGSSCRNPRDPSGSSYSICSPGNAEKVITVGAIDKNRVIAGFSSRGPTLDERLKPDVTAVGVWVTAPGANKNPDTYISMSGTSMATPMVAGIAALILEHDPDVTPDDLKSLLQETAVDRGDPGADNTYGYGIVDAYEAITNLGQCPEEFLKADVFPDGKINILDLFAVTDHWAEECP